MVFQSVIERLPTSKRGILALAAAIGMLASPSCAEVILEDKGLYKKDTWNVGKYYDDLDDATDAPGVVTRGSDPRRPSGPAVDFERRPGVAPVGRGDEGRTPNESRR